MSSIRSPVLANRSAVRVAQIIRCCKRHVKRKFRSSAMKFARASRPSDRFHASDPARVRYECRYAFANDRYNGLAKYCRVDSTALNTDSETKSFW
jgi:hypothetical protein